MAKWGLYERLRPGQIDEILAESPIAYLPWGSLEWHGPHNPIGLDALKVWHLAQMAAQRTGGVVWPPIFAGYMTMKPHAGFKKTIEVPAEVIMGLANAYLDELADEGFKLAVIVMGHYGAEHVKALTHVAENWPKVRAKGRDMKVWAFPEYKVRPEGATPSGDHAGLYETSLMMFFDADLVDLSTLPAEGEVTGIEAGFGIGGEDPRQATAELGRRIAEEIVEGIVAGVRERLNQ